MKKLTFLIIFLCISNFTRAQKLNSICRKPITKPKIFGYYTCECLIENSPQWGEQILIVNCAEFQLENAEYPSATLPEETVSLDLSYNSFSKVPTVTGELLKYMDLSYCEIDSLNDYDFVKLKNLAHLMLGYNKIATINENAFHGLTNLVELDLSNNKIQQIAANSLAPMSNLYHLILSGNHEIGAFLSQVGVDFYQHLGMNPNLETLEVELCNLTTINVSRGGGLKHLSVAKNSLADLSELSFALETLDISENSITAISPGFLPQLAYLKMLLVQDMPDLLTVDADSLSNLPNLNHLSFRGSMKLHHFDSNAFGDPENLNVNLQILNLQGTNIHTFNGPMEKVVANITALDLEGVPLDCDCNVRWLKNLEIETNALCMEPSSLRGIMVSGIPEKKFECHLFPKWVYTTFNSLLILVVLIACSIGVWFIFSKLQRRTKRHNVSVGANSPYAPVLTVKTES